MPIFTDREYRNPHSRPDLQHAWDRLPIVRRLAGLKIRWLGPLVDLGHDVWLSDLSDGAWGYLGETWAEHFEGAGPMLGTTGRVRPEWSKALRAAVDDLVYAGETAGPEQDPHLWASWVCFELSEPRAFLEGIARARGWDR